MTDSLHREASREPGVPKCLGTGDSSCYRPDNCICRGTGGESTKPTNPIDAGYVTQMPACESCGKPEGPTHCGHVYELREQVQRLTADLSRLNDHCSCTCETCASIFNTKSERFR